MAEERASRRALLAARTRRRNEILRGPTERKSACQKERVRIEEGRETVAEAFGGVPNKSAFLKRAHLFEKKKGSNATERAFVVPGTEGLKSIRRGQRIALYWYRRDASVAPPQYGQTIEARDGEGDVFRVTCLQKITEAHLGKLEGKTLRRVCTGAAFFWIE